VAQFRPDRGQRDRVVEQAEQQVLARGPQLVAMSGVVLELEGDKPAEVVQQGQVLYRLPAGVGDQDDVAGPGHGHLDGLLARGLLAAGPAFRAAGTFVAAGAFVLAAGTPVGPFAPG
jgi:hypothetical protein